MGRLEVLPPFAKPRIFPKTPPSTETFPSEFLGFVIRRRTIIEAWYDILWTVMTFGHIFPTDYGLEQREVLSLLSVIENPGARLGRLPDWVPFTSEEMKAYVKNFFEREKSHQVAYNYGNRLQSYWGTDQIESLASELRRSGHSRRALASLWDPVEDGGSAEPPCITTIQTIVRDGQLHLMAYIRSNDMFRAYPFNAAALAELQTRVAAQIGGVKTGSLAILSFSAHIYSDCWDACQQAMVEAAKLRKRFEQDPRGSLVFRLEDRGLVSYHHSPEGDLVQTFGADSSNALTRLVAPFVSRVDHAIYLGREIDRIVSAREGGRDYEQDKIQ